MTGAELVVAAWARFDAGDLDHLDDLFAPDARFGPVRGVDAVAGVVAGHRRAFPVTTHEPVRSLEGDGVACVEGRVVGVTPDGRRAEWLATVWVEHSGDRITGWTTSYDTAAVQAQLDA